MLKEMGLVADIARLRSVFKGTVAAGLCAVRVIGLPGAVAEPANKVFFGPEPVWVSAVDGELPGATSAPNSGEVFLFVDRQINTETGEDFHHTARKILTSAGVQNGS